MRMQKTGIWTAALVTAVTFFAGAALAQNQPNEPNNPQNTTKMCVLDAIATRDVCQQNCRDAFLASTDACRMLNHDCADTARDTRQSCVDSILAALKQCTDTNCAQFLTGIANCKANNPPGQQRDDCVDGEQVLNFQCRDSCRESVGLFAGLKACRDEFRTDIQACKETPPTPPSGGSTSP